MKKLIFLEIAVLFIATTFQSDNPPGGPWQLQTMPFLNNRPIDDIVFIDSLIGLAVTGDGNFSGTDTNYILRTTNAGYNWNVKLGFPRDFRKIQFTSDSTAFAIAGMVVFRSDDKGENWYPIFTPQSFGISDMFAISKDTLWIGLDDIGGFFLFKTTDGGQSWVQQFQGEGTESIYMFNNRIGFFGNNDIFTSILYKTTNSGSNWFRISGQNGFVNMFFIDSLIGWKCLDSMRMTTNGGITWNRQYIPYGGNISNQGRMFDFTNINKDTIWGVGGYVTYPGSGNQNRTLMYRTTNSGNNWSYQIPDTSFRIVRLLLINFINKKTGWSYTSSNLSGLNQGVHTTIGGDTVFYTGITKLNDFTPSEFRLDQNYPNPFNPKTIINYGIKKYSKVQIIVYDNIGKQIQTLVDSRQSPGEFQVDFNGQFLPSGVYFYLLLIDEKIVASKSMMLIK